MSLTILDDLQLSESVIASGVRGRNKRSNTRSVDGGGYAKINVNWRHTLREFELGVVPMIVSAWSEIEALFEATDGGAFGFLMRDPKDSAASGTEGLLTPWAGAAAIAGAVPGFGWGVPTYRLGKRYTFGPRFTDRLITRPMAGAVLRRAAAVVTQGAILPGNAAISLATGTVTFVADQTQAVATITTGATTVLTFANGTGIVAATVPGERLYLTGVTGTGAALLNGLSHSVSAVNAGAFTVTLSVNSTGLVAGAGTAARYPQPTQSLTWSGKFWTPVHFANDMLDWDILRSGPADTRIVAGPSVMLQEVRER